MTFSGLRSRWTTPQPCRAARPSAIWIAIWTASDGEMWRPVIHARSVVPWTYSWPRSRAPRTDLQVERREGRPLGAAGPSDHICELGTPDPRVPVAAHSRAMARDLPCSGAGAQLGLNVRHRPAPSSLPGDIAGSATRAAHAPHGKDLPAHDHIAFFHIGPAPDLYLTR